MMQFTVETEKFIPPVFYHHIPTKSFKRAVVKVVITHIHTHTLPQTLIHKQKVYFARLALSMFPSLSFFFFVCLSQSGLFLLYILSFFVLYNDTLGYRLFDVQSCLCVCVFTCCDLPCCLCPCQPLCLCAWFTVNDPA